MERIGKREKKERTHTIHGHDNTHVPFWLHLALHRTGSKCQFHIPGPSQPAEKHATRTEFYNPYMHVGDQEISPICSFLIMFCQ